MKHTTFRRLKQRIQEKVKFQAQHNDDVDDNNSDHNDDDDGKNNKRKSNGTKSAKLKAEISNKS